MDEYRLVEPLIVAESVRNAWDLTAEIERGQPGNLFPSRVGWMAAEHSPRVAPVLEARAGTGYRLESPEIVRIPKLDRTTRPGSDLAVEDQLILGGVVAALRERIEDGLVTFTGAVEGGQAYDVFERFPLEQADARYVLEADAAGFYQFVSHEILAYELIGLTGWADGAAAVSALLASWHAGGRGLPQGPWPSSILADVYMSRAARSLQRAGLRFSRYSDDFRVVATSWGNVRSALVKVEEAFHDLGLVLAAGKLRTWKIDTYRSQLDRVDDPRLRTAASLRAFQELTGADYEPIPDIDVTLSAFEAVQARRVIDEQLEPPQPSVLGTRLIRRALTRLAASRSEDGLSVVPLVLARYPHLTPNVSRYLRRLMGTNRETRAIDVIEGWLTGRTYRLPWQIGWLLHATTAAVSASEPIATAAHDILYSGESPWFARGQASLAIAIHGSPPSLGSFVSVFEQSPRATRPDLVAAVVIGAPRWRSEFLRSVAADPLLGAVAATGASSVRAWL